MANLTQAPPRGITQRDLPFAVGLLCALIPALVHAVFVIPDRSAHLKYFAGEFGFIENVNNIAGLIAIAFLGLLAIKTPEPLRQWRWFWGLMFLGMVYFIGEEISWGQHIFQWGTPENWPTIRRQHETNLHNLANSMWTNNIPRLAASAAISIALIITWVSRRKGVWSPFALTNVAIPAALMTLLPPVLFKTTKIGLPEVGESEEMYMAITTMLFAMSLWSRTNAAPVEIVERQSTLTGLEASQAHD